MIFQSTRPLRGATASINTAFLFVFISIHAPLAGRDRRCPRSKFYQHYFNPRAPCGARQNGKKYGNTRRPFQSTRPLRGATLPRSPQLPSRHHFNPRAPCGARLSHDIFSDRSALFQSTRPLRGATENGRELVAEVQISIHAPLAGRDQVVFLFFLHPPLFQSTRPLRGATMQHGTRHFCSPISIHAPLAGRDRGCR